MQSDGSFNRIELYADGRHIATYNAAQGQAYFIHDDWLSTERVRSNYTGGLYEYCTSLPFGDSLSCHDGNDVSPLHFTGKMRDTETSLDYFGARYLISAMGRWMTPDWNAKADPVPYGKLYIPQTLNLYGYLRNNPLSGTDADGHCGSGPGDTPCSQVSVHSAVTEEPRVKLGPKAVGGARGVKISGTLTDTISIGGKPTGNIRVSESDIETNTIKGKPSAGNPILGSTKYTNSEGQFADNITHGISVAGTDGEDNSVMSALSSAAITTTDTQTLSLLLPGGTTCTATSTRVLSNVQPDGKTSAKFTLKPSQQDIQAVPKN
jgi:RHS repeat-associated protein